MNEAMSGEDWKSQQIHVSVYQEPGTFPSWRWRCEFLNGPKDTRRNVYLTETGRVSLTTTGRALTERGANRRADTACKKMYRKMEAIFIKHSNKEATKGHRTVTPDMISSIPRRRR